LQSSLIQPAQVAGTWGDQRPGACSRRVFDFVNTRLFWACFEVLEHHIIRESPIGPGFLKEKQSLKTTSTGSSYLQKKTSNNWQFS
jgi:hypothetical protein